MVAGVSEVHVTDILKGKSHIRFIHFVLSGIYITFFSNKQVIIRNGLIFRVISSV